MILGIGIDTVNIKHFEKKLKKSPLLIQRVFTQTEQNLAPKNKNKKIAFYSKRFAAKEAFSKACGTGIGSKISWKDIEIFNKETGAPFIQLSPKAKQFVLKTFKTKKFTCHLSLSDDENAIAFIILEK